MASVPSFPSHVFIQLGEKWFYQHWFLHVTVLTCQSMFAHGYNGDKNVKGSAKSFVDCI